MRALAALTLVLGITLGVCAGIYIWPVVSPKQVGGSWALASPHSATLPYPLSLQGTITDVGPETFLLNIPTEGDSAKKKVRIRYDVDTRVLVRDPQKTPGGVISSSRLLVAPKEHSIIDGEKVRADIWITGDASVPYALILLQSSF
ncbi:MAG: hypothetical protein NT019_00505 [Candidatus Adlerbacteria bacterium]|nr:hypothetical protein [Candidatus Adlerbacteria bacterium]